MPSESQLRALDTQIAPAACSAARLTGVPPEFLCAQCILESGWLAHAPQNNCFGIKAYAGAYGRQLLATREWFTDEQLSNFLSLGDGRTATPAIPRRSSGARKLYDVKDWFATFGALADCFRRRSLMFTEGRYLNAWRAYQQTRDLGAFVRAVGPVYATDPEYAEKVLEIARSEGVVAAVEKHEK